MAEDSKETYTRDKSRGVKLSVFCEHCQHPTNHVVEGSYFKEYSVSDEVAGWSIDGSDDFQIIQCQGCDAISFRHLSWFSENDFGPFDDGTVERLYPKRGSALMPTRDFYNVPPNLRRIYGESVECFNNESSTLCAAGLRALVEGVCAEQGIKDGPVSSAGAASPVRKPNLEGKIGGLQEKGLLTPRNAEYLHSHRFLGNDAVHQLARPSDSELRLAIEIVEHVLDQLYELPEKAAQLRQARALRKK